MFYFDSLTALKASSRFLWVGWLAVLLLLAFLAGLFNTGFLLSVSAGGGTCSLFCFFVIFSMSSKRDSNILRGAEGGGWNRHGQHTLIHSHHQNLPNSCSHFTSSSLTLSFLTYWCCQPSLYVLHNEQLQLFTRNSANRAHWEIVIRRNAS